MMKLLHAFAALLTVVLFLMRKHCIMARVCQTKFSSFEPLPFEDSQTSMRVLRSAEDYKFCARDAASVVTTSCSAMPKYKRDPDIQIDNEHIGVPPRG